MRLKHLIYTVLVTIGLYSTASASPVSTIWVDNADFGTPILQEYNLNTGVLLDQINAPLGYNGRGIVQVGDVVYYTGSGSSGVYAYNYVTNTSLGTVFSIPGTSGLATIAYDGTNFWVGDYSGTNKAYLYSTSGQLLKTISLANCAGYCDGLEYGQGVSSINGGQGFLISNERDGYVGPANTYDIYNTNGTLIKANFITGHDQSGNTGIAFDGTYFYVDNINSSTIDLFNTSGVYVKTLTLTGQSYFFGEDLSVNYAQVLPTPVPEPASLMLLGFGLLGLALVSRHKRA